MDDNPNYLDSMTEEAIQPLEISPGTRPILSSTTDPLWTVDEVAGYLQLQPETVRGLARRGDLPGIKIGKVWRFRKSAVKRIFQGQP